MMELVKTTLDKLKFNNIQGYFLESHKELFPLLDKLILQGSTIGSADSITSEQLGVFNNWEVLILLGMETIRFMTSMLKD